ncbi:MAG: 50S ribosomal protein L24 [Candidatus Diapherotrites archaeon]|nr:50S ribosomal protein L24 [Candidatus Diapherotrites archaeon]
MTRKVCCNLSKELRKSLKRRSLPLRKGDKVRIMRGTYAGKDAKVIRIERKKNKVYLENITRKKSDGTEVNIPIDASNLQIIEVELKDERRFKKTKKTDKKKNENTEV